MPRQPRLDIPYVLHHVIARGIERRDIFADDDKERFVARLSFLGIPVKAASDSGVMAATVPPRKRPVFRPKPASLESGSQGGVFTLSQVRVSGQGVIFFAASILLSVRVYRRCAPTGRGWRPQGWGPAWRHART